MVFKEKNEFDIVMNEIKRYLYTSWKRIAKFIDDDLLGKMYYMKRRFGYYFYDDDIRIVNNRPAIYVNNEGVINLFYTSDGELKEKGYKVLYLEEIDKGEPFITKNEKLKIDFIKKKNQNKYIQKNLFSKT